MKKMIQNFIARILKDFFERYDERNRKRMMDSNRSMVSLMLDIKNNKLHYESIDFLQRLNIHPNNFDKQI